MQYSHCAHDTAKLGVGQGVGRTAERAGRAGSARTWHGRAGAHGRRRQARGSRVELAGRAGSNSAGVRGAAGARAGAAGGAQARWACVAGGAQARGASVADRRAARAACAYGLGQLGARAPGLVFNLVFRLSFFFLSH